MSNTTPEKEAMVEKFYAASKASMTKMDTNMVFTFDVKVPLSILEGEISESRLEALAIDIASKEISKIRYDGRLMFWPTNFTGFARRNQWKTSTDHAYFKVTLIS